MKLKEYMKKNRWNSKSLSEEIGIPYQSIRRIIAMNTSPLLWVAIKLHEFTRGEVSMRELLGECDLKKIDKN